MRTISTELAEHFAGDAQTVCLMLRLDLSDGTSLGITDHSHDLSFDLGDGAILYSSTTGASFSSVVLAAGFDVSNFEVTGPIGETVTRAHVLGGKFRHARARLFMVNWADLTQGAAKIMQGRVAVARLEGARFVFEVRNAADAFNASWGRVLSPLCTAEFGDSQCGVARPPVAATVTAVTDAFRFVVDLGGAHPDDYFNLGAASFQTGELAGTADAAVFDYDGASGAVELLEPLFAAPEVGDTLNLYRGCSKLLKSADAGLPTCLGYANVANFRGWPEVPSSRSYHKVSAPGASYA